ncbi:MAG: phosphatidylglycerophosphatase A [Pirellulales bacterium]|nr:phosphatidylglycerophosphatase A [Pirellulales bacterium]
MGQSRSHKPPLGEFMRGGWVVFLATGAWVGRLPAPGTWGALWGVVLAWAVQQVASPWVQVLLIAAIFAAGVPLCTAAARRLGGEKDPGSIVFDEIASLPVTFFLVPMDNWVVAALGFGLHRLFDISKPPPTRRLEHLPDGLGIMADDLMAGVYSNLALRCALSLLAGAGWL